MVVRSVSEGIEYAERVGYPTIVSPHFSLVAIALGIAKDRKELTGLLERALKLSPIGEVRLKSLYK